MSSRRFQHHQPNATDTEGAIIKTTPIIRDLSLNPDCSHGPTILFERDGTRYFACSAYRSRKFCQFYLPEEKWTGSASVNDVQSRRKEEATTTTTLTSSICRENQKNHPLFNPTQRDKGEAQYHFNDKTVKFFMDQFKHLEIDSIICIGTPSLHQEIETSRKGKLKSFLLDIDDRFESIYKENFALYNMCNHHFFRGTAKYHEFLSNSRKLALVVDPPFGVKSEIIWHGCISSVNNDFVKINGESNLQTTYGPEVFWIFPYFMEGHIMKCAGQELRMSDFHVEYRNHPKYHGLKNKSSPIRIFTNVTLSNLFLQEDEYRYCEACLKWVDKHNLHCDLCETCTTKDGGKSYIHCYKCQKCVKPTWKHCNRCQSCHLADLNSCSKQTSRIGQHQNGSLTKKNNKGLKNKNNITNLKRKNPQSINIKKKKTVSNTNVTLQNRRKKIKRKRN